MKISLNVQTKHYIKALGKKGNQLQIVAAETLNESAEDIQKRYRNKLKKGKVRTKYTLNAPRVQKSNPIKRSGEPRPLHQLNSKVIVYNMKEGKKHYLAEREDGGTIRGSSKTGNRVPIPLLDSRTSKSDNKPVAKGFRLANSRVQTLRINGQKFGVPNDRISMNGRNRKIKNTSQRYAVLYNYINKQGGNSNKIQGDLSKPFFFIDGNNDLGVFKFDGKKLVKLRDLKKSSVRRKAKPDFDKSFHSVTPKMLQVRFVRKAKKELGY